MGQGAKNVCKPQFVAETKHMLKNLWCDKRVARQDVASNQTGLIENLARKSRYYGLAAQVGGTAS